MLYVHLGSKCILLFITGPSYPEDVLMCTLLNSGFPLCLQSNATRFSSAQGNDSKEWPSTFGYKNEDTKILKIA